MEKKSRNKADRIKYQKKMRHGLGMKEKSLITERQRKRMRA